MRTKVYPALIRDVNAEVEGKFLQSFKRSHLLLKRIVSSFKVFGQHQPLCAVNEGKRKIGSVR